MARIARACSAVAVLAAAFAVVRGLAQAPAPVPDEVRIEEFGVAFRPPAGWVRSRDGGPGLLARFTGAAPNPDGRVLDLLISPVGEGMTFEQIRDRAVAAYKAPQKALREPKFLDAQGKPAKAGEEAREVVTAGKKSWDIRILFTDSQGRPVTFFERLIPVGRRVYSLRMAGSGDQAVVLGAAFDLTAAGFRLDARVAEAPDPKPFLDLAAKLRGVRLTGLMPAEQAMITEYEGKTIGWLFTRFERAKFDGREGWYLRIRASTTFPDNTKLRLKAWAFTSEDWSREEWDAAEIRESAEGKSEVAFHEHGKRTGAKASVTYRGPDGTEKSEAFNVPENYLPAAVEPAFCVAAVREGKGEFYFAMHEPKVRTVEYILAPGKAEEVEKVKATALLRRVPGRSGGYTQYIDEQGRTVAVRALEQPTRRSVDKATLMKMFPGSTDLN